MANETKVIATGKMDNPEERIDFSSQDIHGDGTPPASDAGAVGEPVPPEPADPTAFRPWHVGDNPFEALYQHFVGEVARVEAKFEEMLVGGSKKKS